MSLRVLASVLLVASQLAWLPAAFAQLFPVGPEFQVNSYTTSFQARPTVAVDGAGNLVVVWESSGSAGSDTDSSSIQAQRYDAAGMPVGGEFQVNSYTTSYQSYPQVAADAAGNFVVAWRSGGSAGSDTGSGSIQAQRYDAAGTPVGGQFQVNSYTTGYQGNATVAADGPGNFVVAWYSNATHPYGDSDIRAQRYDAAGTPVGGEFQVNAYTTSSQSSPSLAADGAGNFIVAWRSAGSAGSDTSGTSIQAQRYDAAGTPVGGEFQVNSYTTGAQLGAAVAVDGAGNFVVAWHSIGSAGSDTDSGSIQAQRYDAAGTPVGGEFQVNTYTTFTQVWPAVAVDGAGNFVVAWENWGFVFGDTGGIDAQRYDAAGTPVGGEFHVNSYTTSGQYLPAVAADAAGNFVVVWYGGGSAGSDTSASSVHGQLFALTTVTTTSTSSTTTSTLPTTDLLPGRITLIKPGTIAKFVAKPATGTFNLPIGDPVATGGSLRIFDTAATAGDNTYPLPTGGTPPFGWKGLGNPPGSKGYKYKGAGTPSDPCKVVLLKDTVIKAICTGSGVALTPPFAGDVEIVLSLGSTDRYCAEAGGEDVKNDATLTKRKDASAPGACRTVAFPACPTLSAACGSCGSGICFTHQSPFSSPTRVCVDSSSCSGFCDNDGQCASGEVCVQNTLLLEPLCCQPCQ